MSKIKLNNPSLISRIKNMFSSRPNIEIAIRNGEFFKALKEAAVNYLRHKSIVEQHISAMNVNKATVKELLEMTNERKVALVVRDLGRQVITVIRKEPSIKKSVPANKINELEKVLRDHGINPSDFIKVTPTSEVIEIRVKDSVPKGKGKKLWDGKIVEI